MVVVDRLLMANSLDETLSSRRRWFIVGLLCLGMIIAYFDRIKVWEFLEKTGIAPIMASTRCRFRAPLTYPDMVSIGTRISDIGPDGFTMKYIVASHRLSKIAAEGEGLLVTYDYRNNRRAPMPAELKKSILDIEAGSK